MLRTHPRHALWIQLRVIGALAMREIHTRFGRENVGFLWIVIEPTLFTLCVIALRSAIAPFYGEGAHGLSLVGFLMTGYMPFLLFRHIVGRSLRSVRANASLLYHRQIQMLDIYLARFVIELAGVAIAFGFNMAFFSVIGFMHAPADLGLLYLGWFFAAWFSLAFALIVGPLSELSEVVDRLYQPAAYLLVIVSGCFYMADWLPPAVREANLAVNPFLHFFEIIRAGYFGDVVRTYYNLGFLTTACSVMTVAGLLLLPIIRRRIVIE